MEVYSFRVWEREGMEVYSFRALRQEERRNKACKRMPDLMLSPLCILTMYNEHKKAFL